MSVVNLLCVNVGNSINYYCRTAYYGEYKCMGPGASSSGRVKFAKLLSEAEARPFLSMTYLNGNKWLLPLPNL